jgi:cytochrome d ubiquinol oxidase subunit II
MWDFVFAGGSLIAALCQGFILGGLVSGVTVRDGMFSGRALDAFTMLGLFCGLGLIGGYALLGSGWLVWKTDGPLQVFARQLVSSSTLLTAAMMLIVSALSAWSVPAVAARWFAWPNTAWFLIVPVLTVLVLVSLWYGVWRWRRAEAFLLALLVFILGFVGLVISLWPYIVPRQITIWDGVADPQSLAFIGTGIAIILPIVLLYQAQAYWVFRGKTQELDGYGEASRPLADTD